jgi:hypothetical protein
VGILPQQNNGWALSELLLLERGAADAGPSLRNNVLLMMWLGSLAQADIVKAMLISRVLSCAQEKAQQIVSVISRNKEKAVPVSVFLALVVIDVVNHRW